MTRQDEWNALLREAGVAEIAVGRAVEPLPHRLCAAGEFLLVHALTPFAFLSVRAASGSF